MPRLQIKFFGKPQILLDGERLQSLVSKKAQAALFYLVAVNRTVSRSHLAGLLWSDMGETAARANLRVVISKLKSDLESFLIINRREIGVDFTRAISTDLEPFMEGGSFRGRAEAYVGEFLHDFDLNDDSLFSEWMWQEKEKFHQKAVEALAQLAAANLVNRELVTAIADLRRLLELDPWREEAHQQLMLVHAHNGDRAAALAQYEKCVQSLRDGLDVTPSIETTTLFERIKRDEITQIAKKESQSAEITSDSDELERPNNLPVPPLNFVGREEELSQIVNLLQGDDCRLATLTGTGGIGKTRLGLECAHALLPDFVAGVFFISLISIHSADRLPWALANELNLVPTGRQTPKELLLAFVKDKAMLFILDNFEHLLEGIELILELLEVAPNLKFLVTSREPLGISPEWVLPLKGLPFEAEDPDQPHQAATLFFDRARRLDLSFSAEKEQHCVHQICRLVEGMPLALELASAWVRVITCDEIAAEIKQNIDILETDLSIVPSHQKSIRAVFAYSWSLLSDQEQEGFIRLSIFQGGFDRQAAEHVAGISLRALTTLIDKSLLQKEENGRYRIHPLLQQFGLEQLKSEQKIELEKGYASYFVHLVTGFESLMYGLEEELLHLIQIEFGNVSAIFDLILERADFEELLNQILPTVSYYYTRKNLFFDGQALLGKLIAKSAHWTAETQAILQVHGASFDYQLGDFAAGFTKLNHAIPVFQQADLAKESAEAFYYLAIILLRQGKYVEALSRFKDSLSLFESMDDDGGQARALNGLAIVSSTMGEYSESIQFYGASLEIHKKRGFNHGIANLLSNMGSSYGRSGHYEISLPMYLEALEIAKKGTDKMSIAIIESNIGSALRALGRYNEAESYYQLSLPVTLEMGDQRWVAANYNGLGLTYLELQNYHKAANTLWLGFNRAVKIQAMPDALTAAVFLGRLAAEIDQVEAAALWLVFAVNHSSVPADAKERGEKILTTLTHKLTNEQREQLFARAKEMDMNRLQKEIDHQLPKMIS